MREHLSSLLLDRFVARDLSAPDRLAAEQHLSGCHPCRAALAERERYTAAFLTRKPAAAFVAGLQRAPRPRRLRPWLSLLAALPAAALLLLWARPRPRPTTWKGAHMIVERARNGLLRPLDAKDRVRAGDVLQILIRSDRAARGSVWLVDSTGRIDAVTSDERQWPAGETLVPQTMILEAPCRDTWVVYLGDEASGPSAGQALRARLAGGVGPRVEVPAWLPSGALVQLARCE